jgi:hypothetical protein
MARSQIVVTERDLMAAIEALPLACHGSPRKAWTEEMDRALVKGRELDRTWDDICRVLRVSENTARRRYRELTECHNR